MSYRTWEKKFYPKSASTKMSVRDAIKHSLRKWTGLLPENLEAHGLKQDVRDIEDKKTGVAHLYIDSSTCALCHQFIMVTSNCDGCPLRQSLGHRCDVPGAPYGKFINHNDARPMVNSLQKTLERYDAGKLKTKP